MFKLKNINVSSILILLLFLSFVFIVGDIFVSIVNRKNDPIYEFIYHDDSIPGTSYYIYVYNDKIELSKTSHCSVLDCKETTSKKENLDFSQENVDKFIAFLNDNYFFEKYGKGEYYNYDLSDYELGIINGLILDECFFELAYEGYEYRLIYDYSDDIEYNFFFKNDGRIVAKKLIVKEDFEDYDIDTYEVKFSEESMKMLFDYVKKYNSKEISKSRNLYKDEKHIFNSLVENDESYLLNFDTNNMLAYEIYFQGFNCPSPVLKLYNDGTYEFYDSYDEFSFKSGTYDYDVSMIIENMWKYKNNSYGSYIITTGDGSVYKTYRTNVELNNLFNSLGVKLNKCMK